MMLLASALSAAARRRVAPTAQSGVVAAFTLTSPSGGSSLPFVIGHAFKRGDVANASILGADTDVQVTPKNYWDDGSLKFAIIAGRKTLSAGVAATVTLSNGGTRASGANLTTTDLKATGITASIDYSSYGTVSWATTDWDSPFQSLTSGPELSVWTYRKPIGSDAHLVGWLEVRLYAGGSVEVLAWIENGYIRVASPTSKTGTATFTLGGSSRYSAALTLLNHQRAALGSGTTLTHWLGTAPAITPKHDRAYLQSTRLVPTYRVTAATARVNLLTQSYTPLAKADFYEPMPDTGYQESIGILPQWDAIYLTSDDSKAWLGVLINGLAAGRYGTHYRDENTNRPLRFSSYPNLVIGNGPHGINQVGASSTSDYTPDPTGSAPPMWDNPHHPSVGFLAYLISGWNYFLEELQFAATTNYLTNNDTGGAWGYRNFADGIFISNGGSNTTRGAGWAVRTLAQAAVMTPDADTTYRNEFLNSLEANVNYYWGLYVNQSGNFNNPIATVAPYSDYTGAGDNKLFDSCFMNDFFTAAFGYALDLKPAISSTGTTRLSAFFHWKAKSVVGRLGGTGSTEWLYRDACPYTFSIAPADTVDFLTGTGPWHADWGAAYLSTYGTANPGVGGDLQGGNWPDQESYWANFQPAIAYAVRHGVTGAQAGYDRMVGAGNWSTFVTNQASAPEWAVMP